MHGMLREHGEEPGVLGAAQAARAARRQNGGGVRPWIVVVAVVGAVLVAAVAVLAFFVARRRRQPPYHDGPKLAPDVRAADPRTPPPAHAALGIRGAERVHVHRLGGLLLSAHSCSRRAGRAGCAAPTGLPSPGIEDALLRVAQRVLKRADVLGQPSMRSVLVLGGPRSSAEAPGRA